MPLDRESVDLLFSGMMQIGETALEMMKDDFLDIASDEVPVKTHNLQWSIMGVGGGSQWIIGTNVEYAPYVHEGTRPHIIEAKNAQALGPFAFSSYLGVRIGGHIGKGYKGGGQFFKLVHHPGTAPNPFFDRTSDRVEAQSDDYVEKAIAHLNLG